MSFQFRLTFHHVRPGYIRIDEESKDFQLACGTVLTLTARDADLLSKASKFHLESSGYATEELARHDGEKLRIRLQVINSLLGLGFIIPNIDTTSSSVSSEIKEKLQIDHGATALDTIVGLSVFPDQNHFEYIVSGRFHVYPSDPSFIFKALDQVWQVDLPLSARSENALEILGRATSEVSPRTKFLLSYFALEQMVDKYHRSDEAKEVINELLRMVASSTLSQDEKNSLASVVGQLKQHSFKTALLDLAGRITNEQIGDLPLKELCVGCVETRNAIAHNGAVGSEADLQAQSNGLRQLVMKLIWTENKLPSVSIQVPADTIEGASEGLQIRVR